MEGVEGVEGGRGEWVCERRRMGSMWEVSLSGENKREVREETRKLPQNI